MESQTIAENTIVQSRAEPISSVELIKRCLMAAVGVFFVIIAAIGVALPGIPTTGPLILASVFLTKSCPYLEQRLIRNRFFAKFHGYLDGSAEMPTKARVMTITIMWTSISLSSLGLMATGRGPTWLLVTLFVAGVIGTAFIWRYGRSS